MKNLLLVILTLLPLHCATTAIAECNKESNSWYCSNVSEAIEHVLEIKSSAYVIDRNYKGLQPVTAEVAVHETSNSALTTELAKRILNFYPTQTPTSKLIFFNEVGDKLFRLRLTTIGRHPDYTDCIGSTLWLENVDGSEIKNLLPNLNSLLCVVDDNVILVSPI